MTRIQIARGEVLALLCYDEAGEPIALAQGKKRERLVDIAAIQLWMQHVADGTRHGVEGSSRDG